MFVPNGNSVTGRPVRGFHARTVLQCPERTMSRSPSLEIARPVASPRCRIPGPHWPPVERFQRPIPCQETVESVLDDELARRLSEDDRDRVIALVAELSRGVEHLLVVRRERPALAAAGRPYRDISFSSS
jgi:hypothetical protein